MKGSCCSFRNSASLFPDLGFGEAIERDGNGGVGWGYKKMRILNGGVIRGRAINLNRQHI